MLEAQTSQSPLMRWAKQTLPMQKWTYLRVYGLTPMPLLQFQSSQTSEAISLSTQPPTYMEYQMPNPTRIEINCATGVESIIELTDAEVAEMEAAAAIAEADREAKDAQDAADAVAKAALLERLGISEEEAKLLLK
jgi:hypothetical protein